MLAVIFFLYELMSRRLRARGKHAKLLFDFSKDSMRLVKIQKILRLTTSPQELKLLMIKVKQ